MSHKANLTLDQIRELLEVIEKHDTIIIVEESKVLRELLKSEILFLGGNPERIFNDFKQVMSFFGL